MRRVVRLTLVLLFVGAMAAALAGAWLFGSSTGQALWREAGTRSPHELIRYLKRRLEGHPKLEAVLLPPLHLMQRRVEREPPPGLLSSLGKGHQANPMPNAVAGIERELRVSTPQEIRQALRLASPGTRIVIAPGLYPFDQNIGLGQDGTAQSPIVLSAVPGTVWLEFSQLNGIVVDRPHWVFENLQIRGVCARHHACEHAFHVTGRASHTVIRNNRISDFNAHIKVNGSRGQWPDHGLVAYNTLTNTSVRETDLPVTPFDLVGANHWRVNDNVVSNFVKRHGNGVSYGIFMKGASEGGRIERNLVICTPEAISQPGVRVGISFGGGGTGPKFCRDQSCSSYEHREGLAANNIIAHCNDTGLDVNSSTGVTLAHNTLINTSGLALRGIDRHAQARFYGNLYEGVARARDGAQLLEAMNEALDADATFMDADALQLQWRQPPENVVGLPDVPFDFRLRSRRAGTLPGALVADGE